MSERTRRITLIGSVAGYVVAVAGAAGLVTIGAYSSGDLWGTLNDLARLVMTAAIAPLMLSYYEMGGWFPLRLAQAAQTLGWLSCLAWCVVQRLIVVGPVTLDYGHPAVSALAVEAWATVYIGLWIVGANIVAGGWLPWIRWIGLAAGIGTALMGYGLLVDGTASPWTSPAGAGSQVLLPIWAFLMARHLGHISATGGVASRQLGHT
ncbi:MAG: hypothetical protein M3P14_12710 [Chloroflexota bacterium]|nr:hypothetical protein [Chloroflexota bacterium]